MMIFIVGNSRSGTTLLANILGRESSIFMLRELHFFEELYDPNVPTQLNETKAVDLAIMLLARQRLKLSRYVAIGQYPEELLREAKEIILPLSKPIHPTTVFEKYLKQEAFRNDKQIPLEQTPRNVFFIDELFTRFPDAYVINMVRDARDIILSQKFKWRRFWNNSNSPKKLALLFWVNYHPMTMSFIWNSAIEAARPFIGHEKFIQLRYEDLVQNPTVEVGRICRILDIEFHPEMLNVPSNSSYEPEKDREYGIRAGTRERWKQDEKNRRDLAICQKITGDNLKILNYELSERLKPSIFDWLLTIATLPIKSILSLMLNIRRTKNLINFIKKRL